MFVEHKMLTQCEINFKKTYESKYSLANIRLKSRDVSFRVLISSRGKFSTSFFNVEPSFASSSLTMCCKLYEDLFI